MIYHSLIDLIGNTPLMEVSAVEKEFHTAARLLVKIESFNPGGSVKDRAALAMIKAAESSGKLQPGGTIIEPTRGHTGTGLAWIARARGYNVILTMPDTMSVERRRLLAAYGATLVLTPGAQSMKGAIAEAERIRDVTPGSMIMGQFDNPANPEAHTLTTAEEIWRDTDGKVDFFVAGAGTGGTVTGTGRGLKSHNPEVQIIAVEPAGSPVLSGGKAGPHKIQGIGAGFLPDNYDPTVVDVVVPVTDKDAYEGSRILARYEGLLAGISSGAAFSAALGLARDPANAGKTIVALLPDTGERYLSTDLFEQ